MAGHWSRRLGLISALTALGVTWMSAGTFSDGSARWRLPARATVSHAAALQAPARAVSQPMRAPNANDVHANVFTALPQASSVVGLAAGGVKTTN